MSQIVLESDIQHDEYTSKTSSFFDVPFSEKNKVVIENNIEFPNEWQIGLIYGPSGSGKSTLLKTFGNISTPTWDNDKSLISNFYPVEFERASKVLCAVGLSTIPTWFRSFNVLSNGEQFRANLAKSLIDDKEVQLIDEYTSVIDRTVAKSASHSISKWIRKENKKKVIFASCHEDIIEWLQPDWIYNPLEGKTILPRGCLQRPQIELKIFRAKYSAWELFKQYHYLSSDLNKAAKCFIAFWNNIPVAFNATLSFPHPSVKNAWRGSRTIVLPDYQGLGIGSRLSDHVASMVAAKGGRYFSKTIHPSMIEYRLKNKNWKETTHSRKARNPSNKSMLARNWNATSRFCYAFEYVGKASTEEEANVFWEKC
jgi:ABC-type lipoprotein export system ATPase subunit/GNAT superfamily N-acetyltransferase